MQTAPIMPPPRAMTLLAEHGRRLVTQYGLDWSEETHQAVLALLFRLTIEEDESRVRCVGIVGGASSGKSTLFNNLLEGHRVSQINIRSHTTRGPIVAVHERLRSTIDQWCRHERIFLPTLQIEEADLDREVEGRPDRLTLVFHTIDELAGILLFDTPDYTSESARLEGDLTLTLLPWFDDLLVMLDHERWFDAQTLSGLRQRSVRWGQRRMAFFNRTVMGALAERDRQAIQLQATRLAAMRYAIIDYRQGRGFRRLPDDVIQRAKTFIPSATAAPTDTEAYDRTSALTLWIGSAAESVLNSNAQRAYALGRLVTTLSTIAEQNVPSAHECLLSVMTPEERAHLDILSRVLGISGGASWWDRQRQWLQSTLSDIPVMGSLLGARRSLSASQKQAASRVDVGLAFFGYWCDRQFHRLNSAVAASCFAAELKSLPWRDDACPAKPRRAGADATGHEAAERITQLDQALQAWTRRVDAECSGSAPRLVGALGATALSASIVLVAVQGPIGLLTVPMAMAALSASIGKIAAAAGLGALFGKQGGKLLHVIQEKLIGSAEFNAVKQQTDRFRDLLIQHARQCADQLCREADAWVLPENHELVQALISMRSTKKELQG